MSEELVLSTMGEDGAKVVFKEIDIDLLDPCDWNPNEMSQAKFNALYENICEGGVIEPLVVRPRDDGRFDVVGGHHRLEVCKLAGYSVVPCMIKDLTEDQLKFQNMRLNTIRGGINKEKFVKLYEDLASRHDPVDLPYKLGMTSQKELDSMIGSARTGVPDNMKKDFDKAVEKVKTVEDLVLVLNGLFKKHRDTVEKYNYMILDFDGNESIWVRMFKEDLKAVKKIRELCEEHSVSMDEFVRKSLSQSVDWEGFVETLEKIETEEEEIEKFLN